MSNEHVWVIGKRNPEKPEGVEPVTAVRGTRQHAEKAAGQMLGQRVLGKARLQDWRKVESR